MTDNSPRTRAAEQLKAQIDANVRAMFDGSIDSETFHARNREAWDKACALGISERVSALLLKEEREEADRKAAERDYRREFAGVDGDEELAR